MKEPEVSVGVVAAVEIHFTLNTTYTAKGLTISGPQTVCYAEGGISWNGQIYHELTFTPLESEASFALEEVTIGINFHWERKETQVFRGKLKLLIDECKITAINILPVEEYLISVISSEMSPTSRLEFLKAHAVISRSWLLAQIEKRNQLKKQEQRGFFSIHKSESEYIRWYDREDHTIYDVCADDHCQRYQGITKAYNQTVEEAVRSTNGQVLKEGRQICDARFSKCCGGVSEEFQYCWEDKSFPYLKAVRDVDDRNTPLPNLQDEHHAEEWIRSAPDAFCRTNDPQVLSQILNNFDQETTNFYRWTVEYSQTELAQLIREKSRTDYGDIIDLIPLERGKSGRISRLRIVGTLKSFTIGKELEIRRILSPTHLFSSAFIVEKIGENHIPNRFRLIGAGWGHGVGLCQIGAAVMGEQGYNYRDILLHYYRDASIETVY